MKNDLNLLIISSTDGERVHSEMYKYYGIITDDIVDACKEDYRSKYDVYGENLSTSDILAINVTDIENDKFIVNSKECLLNYYNQLEKDKLKEIDHIRNLKNKVLNEECGINE